LKGHTKAVMDLDFDSQGKNLGKFSQWNRSQKPENDSGSLTFSFTCFATLDDCSLLRFWSFGEGLGYHQRLEEHQDILWPWSYCLSSPIHARWRFHHLCFTRQDD
jgi:hypothetical protein